MINVLIVEDSPVIREFLIQILSSDSEISVIGVAHNGEEAVEAARTKKPHVITMDIHMPKLNGFEATRQIMETSPAPIVIVSGSSTADEVATTFRALESGALTVARRPVGITHPDHEATARELIQTIRLMSEVKVVRRWRAGPKMAKPFEEQLLQPRKAGEIQLVAIGASTGGPLAVQTILSSLPKEFPVPIAIVQHMATGFIEGYAEWLSQSTNLPVHVPAHGQQLLSAHVYIAPDGFHLGVDPHRRALLSKDAPENGLRPSVSFLFRSVATLYGQRAIGILLTGMGKDGAEELKSLRDAGAVTIAQDEQSSIVYGMPGEAVRLGAATYVFPPDKIGEALITLVRTNS